MKIIDYEGIYDDEDEEFLEDEDDLPEIDYDE